MKLTALQLASRFLFWNYVFNRQEHPEKSVDFWRPLFPDVGEMEALYQREKVA